MNILIFSWRDPKNPKAGGAEIVTHEHAKAWHKAGHNITLFTSNFKGAKETEILDGITIIRKGNPVFTVYIKAFLWYMFEKHDKFDLIIDHFHGISFFQSISLIVPILLITYLVLSIKVKALWYPLRVSTGKHKKVLITYR